MNIKKRMYIIKLNKMFKKLVYYVLTFLLKYNILLEKFTKSIYNTNVAKMK